MTEALYQPLDHQDAPVPDPEATVPLPPPVRPEPDHRPARGLIVGLAAGILLASGVLAVLIGRIGHSPAEAAEGPPQRFTSPQALVDYLDRRGLTCNGYETVGESRDGVGRGRCEAGGADVAVGVYAIHSEVEAQWSALAGSREPLFMALGENWTVDGPADWTRRVADALNAQYRAQA